MSVKRAIEVDLNHNYFNSKVITTMEKRQY
ncbi:hypothetical protein HNR27_002510 [Ornithinibacillus bavariensis]